MRLNVCLSLSMITTQLIDCCVSILIYDYYTPHWLMCIYPYLRLLYTLLIDVYLWLLHTYCLLSIYPESDLWLLHTYWLLCIYPYLWLLNTLLNAVYLSLSMITTHLIDAVYLSLYMITIHLIDCCVSILIYDYYTPYWLLCISPSLW